MFLVCNLISQLIFSIHYLLSSTYFFQDNKSAPPNLTVKTLKRMHMDMDHGSHAEMTVECIRLGCPKKTIDDRSAKVIQECIACLHKGFNFTKGKLQKNDRITI